ncbi:MAG: hypothetical protein H6658_08855 [Ardenticatenaceae bacterium]|nr:hypothetical protein [Ardenticatenaceae bacterium]
MQQENNQPQPIHLVYLIRLWRSEPEGLWRISLQHKPGDLPVNFPDLESFCHYLQQLMANDSDH